MAADQSGYFTVSQALGAGYSYQAQHYLVTNGDWIRIASGV
ncbi:MAG: type IV toxin-antitoxin system AbiEi family antitoxin domain-containing protein [Ktedonobacterales bacterium]